MEASCTGAYRTHVRVVDVAGNSSAPSEAVDVRIRFGGRR